MELEIAAVLRESQHNLLNDQELTESEKKELLKLSLEEVRKMEEIITQLVSNYQPSYQSSALILEL